MADDNVFNDAAFGRYHLETSIARPGVEHFMVLWARKFFKSRQQWPQLPWFEQLPLYLENLNKEGVQRWQILQAEQAVRLYLANYLKPSLKAIYEWVGEENLPRALIA